MKNIQVIALVVGASVVTFFLSVIFSINMVSISPNNLAKVIKEDPSAFMDAIKEASESYQRQSAQKAFEESFKNRAKIPTKGRVAFGPANAPITIVEYSDFQCPYCQRAAQSVKNIRNEYKGKVNMVYKHFPLSFHPLAKPAAEYFEAVALISHEKARKFHDGIFDDFSTYAKLKSEKEINKSLNALVKKLGLDVKAVKDNLEKASKTVAMDMEEAEKLGVRGTPSFFVNGVRARGDLRTVIDRLLEDM